MKFTDTLRKLWRRWYIVFPGILVAAAVGVGVWNIIPPGYERSATQLLIPGPASMPDGANPYLFLGGLAPAADVLVRAIGSENVLNEVVADHPGVKVEITRDTTTAGPVILIVVTAFSDASAEQVLGLLVDRTATELTALQRTENIAVNNRVTVLPITVDEKSILQQRSRILGASGAGIVGVVLTLLIAGLVDGFSLKRRRRARAGRASRVAEPLPESVRPAAPTDPPVAEHEPEPVAEHEPEPVAEHEPEQEPELVPVPAAVRDESPGDEEHTPAPAPVRRTR